MANETIGRPIRKLNAPDLPEDARQFASGLLLVGREHHTERGQHHIETSVSKRERLSVNLTEGDGQPFRRSIDGARDEFGKVIGEQLIEVRTDVARVGFDRTALKHGSRFLIARIVNIAGIILILIGLASGATAFMWK
jgi:hypothetical protein